MKTISQRIARARALRLEGKIPMMRYYAHKDRRTGDWVIWRLGREGHNDPITRAPIAIRRSQAAAVRCIIVNSFYENGTYCPEEWF